MGWQALGSRGPRGARWPTGVAGCRKARPGHTAPRGRLPLVPQRPSAPGAQSVPGSAYAEENADASRASPRPGPTRGLDPECEASGFLIGLEYKHTRAPPENLAPIGLYRNSRARNKEAVSHWAIV